MALIDTLLSSLLFVVPLLHLVISPHTKVEESFNIQAVHDILVYGTPTSNINQRFTTAYDHFSFPGAVPRSFVGAVVLSGISQPLVALAGFQYAQLIVRAVLGAFNAACLLAFKNALATAFGKPASRWWTVFMVCQFHVMYYLSRTLPNMFAFGLTTLAFACMLPKSTEALAARRRKQAVVLLTLSAAIFRAEIAILLAATGLYLLSSARMSLQTMVPVFVAAFVGSLVMSVPIDSYFWQRPLWPEFSGFYFNTIQGSSSDWGVSPWHYYITSALPRILLNPLTLALIPLSLWNPGTSNQASQLAIPSFLYIAIYSLQPHKEARFIFYVAPPLTAMAAIGADFVSARRSKSILYRLCTYIIALSIPLSLAASSAMLLVSSLNYPGGDALIQLQALVASDAAELARSRNISVVPLAIDAHADVLTCMTGLTLFGQNPLGLPLALYNPGGEADADRTTATPLLFVDKTERGATLGWPHFWDRLEYALEENPALPLGAWEVVGVVHGYGGIDILRPGDDAVQADKERGGGEDRILGLGAAVDSVRRFVRQYTGGYWIGPRMVPKIRVMRRFERV